MLDNYVVTCFDRRVGKVHHREDYQGRLLAAMCDRHDAITQESMRFLKRAGLLGVVESVRVSCVSPVSHEVMLVVGFHGIESTMEVFSSEENAPLRVFQAVLWYLAQSPTAANPSPSQPSRSPAPSPDTRARSGPALGRMGGLARAPPPRLAGLAALASRREELPLARLGHGVPVRPFGPSVGHSPATCR